MTRFARIALPFLVSLVLFSGLPAEDAPPAAAAAPASLFDYDPSAPLDVQAKDPSLRDGASITDLTFAGHKQRVRAYLVAPADGPPGSHAGVLYTHWLGEPMSTNRTQFLDEAVALASQGIVSLLVDAMWAAPKWYAERIPEEDYEHAISQVIELRRAMDVLLAQPRIDPARIAYVGHDFGAMYGTVMGAVDRRATSYVLMAGAPRFADWMLFARQPKDLDAYRAQMTPLDPLHYVGQLAPAPVFFQFALKDEYISANAAAQLYAAAQPRKQMTTYDAGHGLQTAEVAADRITWLMRELARR